MVSKTSNVAGLYKNTTGQTESQKSQVITFYLQDVPDRLFVREELMHIPEDTQVPPDKVSKRQ